MPFTTYRRSSRESKGRRTDSRLVSTPRVLRCGSFIRWPWEPIVPSSQEDMGQCRGGERRLCALPDRFIDIVVDGI